MEKAIRDSRSTRRARLVDGRREGGLSRLRGLALRHPDDLRPQGIAASRVGRRALEPARHPKAAADFPDLSFLIYHAAFKSVKEAMPAVAAAAAADSAGFDGDRQVLGPGGTAGDPLGLRSCAARREPRDDQRLHGARDHLRMTVITAAPRASSRHDARRLRRITSCGERTPSGGAHRSGGSKPSAASRSPPS